MSLQVSAFLFGLLLAQPVYAADLRADDDYLEMCRTVLDLADGEGSTTRHDDGGLTASIWITVKIADEPAEQLGSFCDFSAEPRRFVLVSLTSCYHCTYYWDDDAITLLNREFFGD